MGNKMSVVFNKQFKINLLVYLGVFILQLVDALFFKMWIMKPISFLLATIIISVSTLYNKKKIEEDVRDFKLVFACAIFFLVLSCLVFGLYHLDLHLRVLSLLRNTSLFNKIGDVPLGIEVFLEAFLGTGLINEMLLSIAIISYPFKFPFAK